MNKTLGKLLAILHIRGWKCTCARCFVTNYSDNFNDAILAIKHRKTCSYRYGQVRTKFNAVKVGFLQPKDIPNLQRQ